MNDTELKPCPFCGGEAKFMVELSNEGEMYKDHWWVFRIYCPECKLASLKTYKVGAELNQFGKFKIDIDERNEAIEAWNRRTNNE